LALCSPGIKVTNNKLTSGPPSVSGRVLPVRPGLFSLTRIIVTRSRHDQLVEALVGAFCQVRPVLSVIPADNEQQAIAVANDTIYGLNASLCTPDVDRARDVAAQLRSGTVGHNAFRTDFGGFTQSGIGREGLRPFPETETVILDAPQPATATSRRSPDRDT
jgi:hypothetical protein